MHLKHFDALMRGLCGCDTESVLRAYLPLHDGTAERVNGRLVIFREHHEYRRSPSGEELLNYHGRIELDGEAWRFAWTVIYRGAVCERSALDLSRGRRA